MCEDTLPSCGEELYMDSTWRWIILKTCEHGTNRGHLSSAVCSVAQIKEKLDIKASRDFQRFEQGLVLALALEKMKGKILIFGLFFVKQ